MSDKLRGGTTIGGFLAIHAGNLESFALGLTAPSSGTPTYPYITAVKQDGVMEIGRYIDFHHSDSSTADFDARLHTDGSTANELFINNQKIWHAGNDGSGSGLDADLLDGEHASAFANASHSHSYLPLSGGTLTGNLYIPNIIYHSGDTNTYMQFHAADQWRVVTGGVERFEVNNSYVKINGTFHYRGYNQPRTVVAATAPSSPATNDIWINTSV